MNRSLLAYGVLLGTAVGTHGLLVGGLLEGAAIAKGIAVGTAIFVGYPTGRRLMRLVLAGELRLLDASLRRASDIAAQYRLSLPEGGANGRRPPLIAWVVVGSISVGAASTSLTAVLAILTALLMLASLPVTYLAVVATGTAATLGLAAAFGITLYYRGRIEWLAFRLSVVRGTDVLRQKANSLEHALGLRSVEPRHA